MQLEPEDYIELPTIVCETPKGEIRPKFKKVTYQNFALNDVPPKEDEKFLYIEYKY